MHLSVLCLRLVPWPLKWRTFSEIREGLFSRARVRLDRRRPGVRQLHLLRRGHSYGYIGQGYGTEAWGARGNLHDSTEDRVAEGVAQAALHDVLGTGDGFRSPKAQVRNVRSRSTLQGVRLSRKKKVSSRANKHFRWTFYGVIKPVTIILSLFQPSHLFFIAPRRWLCGFNVLWLRSQEEYVKRIAKSTPYDKDQGLTRSRAEAEAPGTAVEVSST